MQARSGHKILKFTEEPSTFAADFPLSRSKPPPGARPSAMNIITSEAEHARVKACYEAGVMAAVAGGPLSTERAEQLAGMSDALVAYREGSRSPIGNNSQHKPSAGPSGESGGANAKDAASSAAKGKQPAHEARAGLSLATPQQRAL